jgi:2,3-diketo-5-methylthio-1-phosphopentane phosphatase
VPFDSVFDVMKTALEIDPDFRTFHEFCVNNSIPFNVISAGLKPVLRRVLDHFIGEEMSGKINIVANDAQVDEQNHWRAVWLHADTDLGHDKALSLQDYKATAAMESDNGTIPLIVFIGDGVSDLPAARESDVLFARRGLKLEEYCIENKLEYIPFDTFADIQKEVIKLAKVDEEKTKGRGVPVKFNPRANMWRRVSSKAAVPVFSMFSPTKEEKAFVWPDVFTETVVKPEQQAQKLTAAVAAPPA